MLILKFKSCVELAHALDSEDPYIEKAVDVYVDWSKNFIHLFFGKVADSMLDALAIEASCSAK